METIAASFGGREQDEGRRFLALKNKVSKEFLEFSLSRSGVLTTRYFGAYFKLKSDIRSIFPYINASMQDVRYFDRPEYVQFFFEGIKCTLYPNELISASFLDETAALSFFNRLMDFIGDLYRRQDEIEPNYRKHRPPSVIDILRLLPRSNCRECGYPTCMSFAVALRNGEATPDHCGGFARPISVRKVYPVFDEHGHLASTVTIDIDTLEDGSAPAFSKPITTGEPETDGSSGTGTAAPDNTPDNGSGNPGGADFSTANGDIGDPPLTQREIQVLGFITDGSTNMEIANRLGISPHTVKSHVVHIFNKLGVNDRTQAAVWAMRYGLKR
jgi:DNA-binding CsgD family transcriptional regulator/ArsR family metal-binding transcriptional regulator